MATSNVIHIQPWGGAGESDWTFSPTERAKLISIAYGGDHGIIDSLTFTSLKPDGSEEIKIKAGGPGGHVTNQVNINGTSEYLTGITGTYGNYGGQTVIRSIKFQTNKVGYGPYGSGDGTPFHFVIENGGRIVGFHGRFGAYVNAIGVQATPQ